ENGAQLRFKNVLILKTKPDRAPAKERIQLIADVQCTTRQFIAAQIKRANDQRIGPDALGNLSIGFVLLVLARQGFAVQIEKLGTIKSDSLRAIGCDGINICRKLNISRENNVTPIAGDGGGLAQLLELRRDFSPSGFNLLVVLERYRRSIDDQPATAPIDENARPSFD